jgi:hypothetical protein
MRRRALRHDEASASAPVTARSNNAFNDPRLTAIANVWPDLPDYIKAAILALVGTVPGLNSSKSGGGQ